jgi:thiol:disulfide interchange protein
MHRSLCRTCGFKVQDDPPLPDDALVTDAAAAELPVRPLSAASDDQPDPPSSLLQHSNAQAGVDSTQADDAALEPVLLSKRKARGSSSGVAKKAKKDTGKAGALVSKWQTVAKTLDEEEVRHHDIIVFFFFFWLNLAKNQCQLPVLVILVTSLAHASSLQCSVLPQSLSRVTDFVPLCQ